MRVLVTRPERGALATAARLRSRGHQPVIAPVIEIIASGVALPDGTFDAVIVTSAQAIDALSPEIAGDLLDIPLLAVGTRTVAAAKSKGFLNIAAPATDAAELVASLREAGKLFRNVLYLAGRDRKPLIERSFDALGLSCSVVEVYEARPLAALPDAARLALQAGEADAVLHFSRRSAEIFLRLAIQTGLLEALRAPRHICLSPDVAQPLLAYALTAEIAARPDAEALFEALETR